MDLQRFYLSDDALLSLMGGGSDGGLWQAPKSPALNIMPTPKAVQPLTVGGTIISSHESMDQGSLQNTCIKNPRNSSIVVVPNQQAVAGGVKQNDC
jgi:hypothetical protein